MLGKTLGGRYQIIRHLGGGGFGQTYLAEDRHLPGDPACVVKHLKPRLTDPEAIQAARRLFDTEAQVLYRLGSHDQIPRLFAHFEQEQDFFLVQEWVDGEVFSQELKVRPSLTETEVSNLLQDTLTVLEFVHEQQVVHRDIKPSNLIRRRSDRRLVLIDFGAVKEIGIQAKDLEAPATITIAVGSSGYMPSEQIAGKPRYSSDIYAIGMLAIQCLTGIYPKRLREDPVSSEIIWRDQVQVSSGLADLIDRMVRYDYRQRFPTAKEALAELRALTAVQSVDTLLVTPKPISSDGHLAWVERGDELFQLQRYKEAVSAYDRVIQARPEDEVAWFKRGISLENLGCYEDAASSYERVVQLQPEDYLAWYKRGNALENLMRYAEALEAYDRVVQLQPENYWAWHDRGKVLENLHRPEDAIASYDRAVQLKPDFQLAVENRKRVLSQLKRVDTLYHLQHYDEALASCDRAIAQNPDDSLAWLMRGMALENLQQFEEAVVAYDRVVALQPEDHVAWYRRGNVLEQVGQLESAIASFYRVAQIQPDNQWAWFERGRLLEALGRAEEALTSYDRATQLRPDFQAATEGRKRMLLRLQWHNSQSPESPDEATIVSANPQATEPIRTFVESNSGRATRSGGEAAETTIANPDPPGPSPELSSEPPPVMDPSPAAAAPIAAALKQPAGFTHWFNKGRTLEKIQHYPQALIAYNQAIQIRNDDPDVWRWRGNVLYALQRYEEAIASYDRALQLRPGNADLWCCVGRCLIRLKRYREAVTGFDQAIALRPGNHVPWHWRGRVLCELKQFAEAVQSFNQALALKPDFQPAIDDRQRLFRKLQAVKAPQSAASATPPIAEPESNAVPG